MAGFEVTPEVGGLGLILQGIPLLFLHGQGLIPIALGFITIHYARAIFRMQKQDYRGGLVMAALTLAAYLAAFLTSKTTSAAVVLLIGAICYTLVTIATPYNYREFRVCSG